MPAGCSRSSSTTASTTPTRRSRVTPAQWPYRSDPFSTYRAGFEVRTYRLCQRVLMFHHFPERSRRRARTAWCARPTSPTPTSRTRPALAIPSTPSCASVTQTGLPAATATATRQAQPAAARVRSTRQPVVQDTVRDVDADEPREPARSGSTARTTSGSTSTARASPASSPSRPAPGSTSATSARSASDGAVDEFAPARARRRQAEPRAGRRAAQFLDLAGDGQLDLVVLDGPTPGFYEHDDDEGWEPFRAFTSRLNLDCGDPNLRFVDLDGDGHADVLITEDDAFIWYPSLAEDGFGPARARAPGAGRREQARAWSSPTARSPSTSPTCPATA